MHPAIDLILERLHLRPESLAERVNRKMISGYEPSEIAKSITADLSSDDINNLMIKACRRHSEKTGRKVLID